MMDNRQFNVNGKGKDMLLRALELACIQKGSEDVPAAIRGWKITPEHGMILYWAVDNPRESGVYPLPFPGCSASDMLAMIWVWLENSEQRAMVKVDKWDANAHHDGSNGHGWRVYCEDWGHVDGNSFAICAVKPVWLWYGK
jgi:hypothetical protein